MIKNIILAIAWFTAHFDLKCVFVPFAIIHKIPVHDESKPGQGFTDVFIFGLRVAHIHRTYPWLSRGR